MTTTAENPSTSVVGQDRPRVDSPAKLTGAAPFVADVPMADLLHARLVLSHDAHARIRSIDRETALALPGVHSVLVWEDLPIRGGVGRVAEPLAREEVVFAGQPVAMVLAVSEATAEDGVEAVAVEYEPLPQVVDLRSAIEPSAPLARMAQVEDEADVEMHGAAGGGAAVADWGMCPTTWSIARCSPRATRS